MTFLESLKTCLVDKYATFSGRASRSEFWWFFLFLIIVGFVLDMLFPWAQLIGNLFLFIPFLSVAVRRLHDINRSGWWQLINILPIVITIFILAVVPPNLPPIINLILIISSFSIIMLIWLRWTIKKGTPGPNRFGEDPLQQPQFMNTETGLVAETNHPAPAGHPSVGGEK
jgi:uncharacterized membrane protein YhaH (DUF805 family)